MGDVEKYLTYANWKQRIEKTLITTWERNEPSNEELCCDTNDIKSLKVFVDECVRPENDVGFRYPFIDLIVLDDAETGSIWSSYQKVSFEWMKLTMIDIVQQR